MSARNAPPRKRDKPNWTFDTEAPPRLPKTKAGVINSVGLITLAMNTRHGRESLEKKKAVKSTLPIDNMAQKDSVTITENMAYITQAP